MRYHIRMYRSSHNILILFLFLGVLHSVKGTESVDTATVSITAAIEFAIEPACVQSCMFYNSFGVADYLLYYIGCTRFVENIQRSVPLFVR
jgi:hypothetical protein